MTVRYDTLSLIRSKDGVSVWRVTYGDDSYVMKCFDNPEHRREIANYQILASLSIPTLKMISYTDSSIVIEDIERSAYRLGTPEDLDDLRTAGLIAHWYRTLHENGREYAGAHSLYDECDSLSEINVFKLAEKTCTAGLAVWQTIDEHLDLIKSKALRLPRTLTYNDFYYTNLAVARDWSSAIVFDYNLLGKGYVYSDIRNVCSSLGNESAITVFRAVYGEFDESEEIIDDVVSPLIGLHVACQRKVFPEWANESLEMVKDGRLMLAVERLLWDSMKGNRHDRYYP